jgi:hypothetical protein
MDEVNPESIRCENCQHENPSTIKFCPQCSFPVGGTEDEKRSFRLLVSSKRRLLSDAQDKIKSARTTIWVIAGLTLLFGLFAGFAQDNFEVMIVNIFLSIIYLGMAAWANTNPFGAILTSFIIYATVIAINAFLLPTTLLQGIILKVIIIGAFIKGIRSAQEAQGYLKELEKVKAVPVGGE